MRHKNKYINLYIKLAHKTLSPQSHHLVKVVEDVSLGPFHALIFLIVRVSSNMLLN
jgi:hypothetical protein